MSAPSQPQAGSASANHPETRPLPTGPKGAGTSPPVHRRGETWTRPPCGGHDGARGTSRARGVPARFSPTPAVSASIPFLGAPPRPLNPNSEVPVLQQPAPLLCGTEGGSALCPHMSGRFPLTVLATPHQGSGLDSGLGLPNPVPPEPGTPVLPVPSGPLTPSAPAPSISPGPEPCGTPDPPGLFLSPQVLRASCGEQRKALLLPASV